MKKKHSRRVRIVLAGVLTAIAFLTTFHVHIYVGARMLRAFLVR